MNWDAIDAARESSFGVKEKPEGSFDTREYAARYKIQMRTAFEQLSRLVHLGKLKQTKVYTGKTAKNYYTAVESSHEPTRTSRRGNHPERAQRA